MVSEGAAEEEIIIQINAVKQAAHRVGQMLLNSKVNDCIRAAAQSGDADEGIEAYPEDIGVLFQNVIGGPAEIRTEVPLERAVRFLFFLLVHEKELSIPRWVDSSFFRLFNYAPVQYFRSRERYWIASVMCGVSMRSLPARSAMVRAILRSRS